MDDPPADDSLLQRQTTGEDRVRMVARQLSQPRTANWIASEADWSHQPTRRVLERLVDDGGLQRDESGAHTTYYTDYRQQAIKEATRLRDSAGSVEELTDSVAAMSDTIDGWTDEFDVSSPDELRATIEPGMDDEERSRRRETAREWDHLARRIEIARFAIREWEFLDPRPTRAHANG